MFIGNSLLIICSANNIMADNLHLPLQNLAQTETEIQKDKNFFSIKLITRLELMYLHVRATSSQ